MKEEREIKLREKRESRGGEEMRGGEIVEREVI